VPDLTPGFPGVEAVPSDSLTPDYAHRENPALYIGCPSRDKEVLRKDKLWPAFIPEGCA
jgi:hypothetical protein